MLAASQHQWVKICTSFDSRVQIPQQAVGTAKVSSSQHSPARDLNRAEFGPAETVTVTSLNSAIWVPGEGTTTARCVKCLFCLHLTPRHQGLVSSMMQTGINRTENGVEASFSQPWIWKYNCSKNWTELYQHANKLDRPIILILFSLVLFLLYILLLLPSELFGQAGRIRVDIGPAILKVDTELKSTLNSDLFYVRLFRVFGQPAVSPRMLEVRCENLSESWRHFDSSTDVVEKPQNSHRDTCKLM
ncbi:hypothetical protein RRG08_050647 [Elysia crispata]|uniref:Uncharacterized protein n=1 Tax=Elysia crispata TaxID=231223 RepID=A0AAE1AE52_9GAST|nr:hypothetical protein RRG08_050647 [Elysia crispata]